jgi:hypothetical protein
MSDTVKTGSIEMDLDKAFRQAVTLAWEDLMTPTEPRSVRVEYLCDPGQPLDNLSVWSVRAGGYQDLVCDYWTRTSANHPSGATFGDRHRSDKLGQALDFVMKNQGQFTRPPDACRNGLVQVYPPSGDERAEAATWINGERAKQSDGNTGEAPKAPHGYAQQTNQSRVALPDATGHSG